jgi:hypothetical protein
MKKTLLFLTAFFTLTLANAQFTVDNIEYTITTGTDVEVTGSTLATINIPAQVVNASNTYDVVAIGASAFENNTTVTNVVLPISVTILKSKAFKNASNLAAINLQNIIETENAIFVNCVNLESIGGSLDNLLTLGDYTFNRCLKLTSIKIPVLTSFGTGAIYNSTNNTYFAGSITNINIPSSVTSIGSIFLGRLWDLTKVQVNWATPLDNINSANFFRNLDLSKITLYVPVGTKAAYEAHAVWGLFPDANIVEGSPLGLKNIKELKALIYPNPSSGYVYVQTETQKDLNLTIYDLTGKELLSTKGKQIDFSNLSQGIYILKGKTEEGEFTKRIVKQ